MNRVFIALLFIALMFYELPVRAADKPSSIALDGYVRAVMEHSPDAAGIMAEIDGMKADGIETGQKINPDLQADVTAARRNASRELEVEFEQPLRPSDFGARKNYAAALHSTLNSEQKARLLDLSHDAVRAYVDLWIVQERIALLDRLIRDAGRQTKTVQDAARQGLADKAETEILTTEAAGMKLQRTALESEKKALLASFVRLAGIPYADLALKMPSLPTLPGSAGDLLALADTETSVRAILEGRRAVAESRLAVANADAALPEFAPRAVYRRDLNDDSSSFLLGTRVSLPVWSRNEAERLRARASYKEADAALKALDANDMPSVLAAAWQGAVDAENVSAQYGKEILPGWRNVQKLTEQKLAQGQASVFDLWQVQSRVLEAETTSLESRKNAIEAVLNLETLSGVPFLSPLLPLSQGEKQ